MKRAHFLLGLKYVAIVLISLYISFFIDITYIYAGGLKEEAESYRLEGYKAQEKGDIDTAISLYQKAAEFDPDYAAPHNDLGILFEAKGWLDRAEAEYQKALAIDPDYEKAHTNLALLYERKGELEKAAFHWMRRHKLGNPNDPWTYEAKQRLEKLGLLGQSEEKPAKPESVPNIEKQKEDVPPVIAQEKETEGWTRLGTKKDAKTKPVSSKQLRKEKVIEKKPEVKPEVKPEAKKEPEKKKIDIAKKPETPKKIQEPKKKTDNEWTRVSFGPKEKEEPLKRQSAGRKTTDIDKELQESLKLAEQRLRAEKEGVGVAARPKQVAGQKKVSASTSAGAKTYYARAQDYYNKGEYAKALDIIRESKEDYPEDSYLLDLEQSVKNRMKEERIEDHYNEGIMRYRQEDYSGARKEFEAILSILPE